MMRRTLKALVIVGAAGSLAACDKFFTGPGIDTNPNVPVDATADQLFVGFQAFNTYNLTGDVNRVISLFTQQMAGTGRQWAGYDQYTLTENDFSWDTFYEGGGLVDLFKVQDKISSDKIYLGITQVWEALTVGILADVWGDIPFSEAGHGNLTPKLDHQLDVYTALQTLLDQAIANLNGAGVGPGPADLIYGGDKTAWIAAAHTLKARLYMHVAEVDPTAYAKALTETASGIASSAGDFTTYQSSGTGEANHWYQFRLQRGTDMSPGKFLVDLMKSRNDPRLSQYFSAGPGANGVINGAPPGFEYDATISWLSATRGAPGFRQPVLTSDENTLIKAEAQFKTGASTAALATLNAYRTRIGMSTFATLAGNALYTQIMQEKYVALFQNIESWNDYKRTCYPNVTPVDGSNYVPARLLYGTAERNANPNIPSPSQQLRRNANDPKTATAPDGSGCRGQG
jgi:hypothetical protein